MSPVGFKPLSGGCVAQVYQVELPPNNALGYRQVVVKYDPAETATLDLEGRMLRYLSIHTDLPIPGLFHSSRQLLVMEWRPGQSHFTQQAQEDAGRRIAQLHKVSAPIFGFEEDTLIGGLPQPNPPCDSWLEFFREHRIRTMAQLAHAESVLPAELLKRLETFCDQSHRWLIEPQAPALLHGDLWGGNILADTTEITGLLDPAIYYGHPEIELAFTTLFNTFDTPFFKSYAEHLPIAPGFFEIRKDLYNLYPRLVHVRLFGRGYLSGIDETLKQIGL